MNTPSIDIIVTRHPNLVALLIERGIIDEGTRVIEHAKPDDVRGKHVLGILPHYLSSLASSITEIPLRLTRDDRELMAGSEMPLDRMREVAGNPVTYIVRAESYHAAVGACFEAAHKACGGLSHIHPAGSPPKSSQRIAEASSLDQLIASTEMPRGIVELWAYDEQTIAQVSTAGQPAWRAGSNLPHCESKPWRDMFGRELPAD